MTALKSIVTKKSLTAFFLGFLAGCSLISFCHLNTSTTNIYSKLVNLVNSHDQYETEDIPTKEDHIEDSVASNNTSLQAFIDKDDLSNRPKSNSSNATIVEPARLLCMVMSNPATLSEKAVAINNTWGRRCDVLLFTCETTHPDLPILLVNVTTGREFLPIKHREAFDIIYRDYLHKADWFLKADDDTYVLVENLRRYISDKDPLEPSYYGHHFVQGPESGYFSGGSGYLLSWEAMKRFGERKEGVYRNITTDADDMLIGFAMEALGVKHVDGLDSHGFMLFHPLPLYDCIIGAYPPWYELYEGHHPVHGIKNMTDRPISFHYVTVSEMYLIEYFVYRVLPVPALLPSTS